MKITYASDIHIEFGNLNITNDNNADVLILAGDICVDSFYFQDDCRAFFEKCSNEFEHVIYVLGNHEHYYGDINSTYTHMKLRLSDLKNIHVLEDEYIDINDIRFLGSTLWTNINDNDVISELVIRRGMNDFKIIKNRENNLQPRDIYEIYQKSIRFIMDNLKVDGKNVVVTHHAPSQQHIHADYMYDYHMNGAYRTELRELIEISNITAWVSGHTHYDVDFMIGNTRMLSNQRGYIGDEKLADYFILKSVDI